MTTLNMKPSLVQAVESASGGRQTVIFTAKNQATFMTKIDKFDLSTIDASLKGTHPAFIVNGVEKDFIYVATYEGVLRNGELLSLPNVKPENAVTREVCATSAFANGPGHHLLTSVEWSAIMLRCQALRQIPVGNTANGQSSRLIAQGIVSNGRRVDGIAPGDPNGLGVTYTGSGDVNWRHDVAYNGISDLVGNVNDMVQGVRLVNGEIQVIPDNNASLSTFSTKPDSKDWRAIDAISGDYIVPDGNGTTTNSVKWFQSGATDYSIIGAFQTPMNQVSVAPSLNVVQVNAINKLKALGIFPAFPNLESGYCFAKSTGVQYASRGGHFFTGDQAGISHISLSDPYDVFDVTLGCRTAYIPQ